MVWDESMSTGMPGNISREQFNGLDLLATTDTAAEEEKQRALAIQQCVNTVSTNESTKSSATKTL